MISKIKAYKIAKSIRGLGCAPGPLSQAFEMIAKHGNRRPVREKGFGMHVGFTGFLKSILLRLKDFQKKNWNSKYQMPIWVEGE